jgi:peptide/nickel transport system permease protein
MAGYLGRRLVTSLLVVVGISIVIFAMLHLIYPSPAIDVLGVHTSPQSLAAWNKANGFDRPWPAQYLSYVNQLLHGNLGYSYKVNQSVDELFAQRWMRSAWLAGVPLVLAVLLAIPVGIYQAVRRNSVGDMVLTSVTFTAYAMPDFFLYLIVIQVFALSFPIFSYEASQFTSIWQIIGDWHAMTLPILSLVLLYVSGYARYMRSSSIDTLAQDYIKAARAKGLPERLVLWRHLIRNAFLPMLTLIGLSIPALLAGNIIAEQVWNYPGLGLLFYDSLGNADYNVLMAYTMIGAVLTVLGNLLADVALTVSDPRIRLA